MDLFTAFAFNQGIEPPIPLEEQQYYQDPSYYKDYAPSFSLDAVNGVKRIVPFVEQTAIEKPSKRGLYRAEIALLKYCSYGTYPHPRHGYPGLWWYQYGIKNVGYHLQTLERRGFIQMSDNGKYALTDIGREELAENKDVLDV